MRLILILLFLFQGYLLAQSFKVENVRARRFHGFTFAMGVNKLFPSTEFNAVGRSQKIGYEHRVSVKKSPLSLIGHMFYSRDINKYRPSNKMTLNLVQDKLGFEFISDLRLADKLSVTAGIFGNYTISDKVHERHSRKEKYQVAPFEFNDPNLFGLGVNLGVRYYGEMFTHFIRRDYFYHDGSNQHQLAFRKGAKMASLTMGVVWAWEAKKRRRGCSGLFENPS